MMFSYFEECICSSYTTATWVSQTSTATTSTAYRHCRCGLQQTNYIYDTYEPKPEPLPKCEHESVIQMRRINLMADRPVCPKRKPQRVIGRVHVPILPRQRIKGWPSLKERRASWGVL